MRCLDSWQEILPGPTAPNGRQGSGFVGRGNKLQGGLDPQTVPLLVYDEWFVCVWEAERWVTRQGSNDGHDERPVALGQRHTEASARHLSSKPFDIGSKQSAYPCCLRQALRFKNLSKDCERLKLLQTEVSKDSTQEWLNRLAGGQIRPFGADPVFVKQSSLYRPDLKVKPPCTASKETWMARLDLRGWRWPG